MMSKRIEPSTTGYICYLNDAKVGTRPTEAEARDYLNELAYDAERGALLPFEPTENEYDKVIRIMYVIETHAIQDGLIASDSYESLPFAVTHYGPRISPSDGPKEPISTLADGSVVYGTYDTDDTHCCIHTDTASGWYISADGDGYAGVCHKHYRFDLDGITLEKLAVLKDLVNSGAIEHMLTCAAAWEADRTIPALQPATPCVRMEHYHIDTEEVHGTRFLCGDGDDQAEVCVEDGDHMPVLYAFGREGLELDRVERVLSNIIALLNSPQVKRAITTQPESDCKQAA